MSGGSGPHSTPLRKSGSKNPTSDDHVPLSIPSQKDLKDIMRTEIDSQVWQFDATRISRMLSPKKPKDEKLDLHDLDNYDCQVETRDFKDTLVAATNQLEALFPLSVWNKGPNERRHYEHLTAFLNSCVKHGGDALHSVNSRGSWYEKLNFVTYDRETGDGVDGAHPLKPDLAGGTDIPDNATLYWSPPKGEGSEALQVKLPVEVKKNWAEMVSQAATYARCLFSANPSRVFAVVFAYNHTTYEFRCLIFHRGGLTAQKNAKLTTRDGRTDVLRIVMTLLLWSEPQDAGFMSTSDDFEYFLPQSPGGENYIEATVKQVLHESICVRGRATRVCHLTCRSPGAVDSPATPKAQVGGGIRRRSPRLAEKIPTKMDALPTSVEIPHPAPEESPGSKKQVNSSKESIHPHFRPSKLAMKWGVPTVYTFGAAPPLEDGRDVVIKGSWQLDDRKTMEADMYKAADGCFGTPAVFCSYDAVHPSGEPISNHLLLPRKGEEKPAHWNIFSKHIPTCEGRTLCYAIFLHIGRSLVHAKSSSDLCMALVHALLGWLSFYQKGFMHRDISIGNVLLNLVPVDSQPFTLTFSEEASVMSTSAALNNMELNESESSEEVAEDVAEEIMLLVKRLEIEGKCRAFVTDGDMAANLETYFTKEHQSGTRSGTPEFMALQLHEAMLKDSTSYIQSPVDDIESFFWLALWATLFNRHYPSETRSKIETNWQKIIDSADYKEKTTFTTELHNLTSKAVTKRSLTSSSITRELLPLLWDWWKLQVKLRQNWQETIDLVEEVTDLRQRAKICLDKFRLFAFCGVRDFLQLVVVHRNRLKECPVFPDPPQ
ncbi:hypothetical protein C8R43DRAFT_991048 [Mycena crocata]|nr:hypothetical protein C8R43DRAFT_991048 [Mycena crocata]